MKRLLFALLALCINCSVFALNDVKLDSLPTNGMFIISDAGVQFDSKDQIVYNSDKDTVYIAFGESDVIKLNADVKNSINRDTIIGRIKANKKIFVRIEGTPNATYPKSKDAEVLVDSHNGGNQENAYVIIRKSDMPFTINVDSTVINVIEFTPSDRLHYETIRNYVAAYQKLPECHKDTISITKIDDYTYNAFELTPSNAWKETSIKYYINEQECNVVDGKIRFPNEFIRSIKPGDELIVSYKVEFKHDYFGPVVREGELLKLYIKPANSSLYWWLLLLVPIIGVIVWRYLPNREKSNGDIENQPLSNNDKNNDEPMGGNEDATDANTVDDVLSTLMPNIDSLATQEKIEMIKGKIKSFDEMEEYLSKFYQELSMQGKSTPDDFLAKLRTLKKEIKELKETLDKSPEDVYGKVISSLRSNDSKILSSLVEKAEKDGAGVHSTNYAILNKFINILRSHLEDTAARANTISQDVDLITEQQMDIPANRHKMMVWMIGQLELRGYKELNKKGLLDDNFNKLSQILLSASKIKEGPSTNDIINTAVINDQFTEDQKNILLRRIVAQINSHVNDETALIESSISIDKFISIVSEKIQLPDSYAAAQEIIRNNNLKLINDVLESNINDLTQQSLEDALRSAIVKVLIRQLKGLDAETLEDVIQQLSISLTNSAVLANTLKEYNISTIGELPTKIRKEINDEIIASVNQKVNQFFLDKHFDSVPTLVNALLKLSEDFKENEALIAGELEEKISMRNSSYVSSGQDNIIKLLNNYNDLIAERERQLIAGIEEKTKHISRLESKVESKQEEVNILTQKNTTLMTESEYMQERLRNGAEKIIESCRTILHPCSDNDESQCVDIEDRLFADLSQSMNRIKTLQISSESIPIDTRKAIQQILIQELSVENSPINTVCRYYAYSRLPFMTDTSREYGITFNRKNISTLFNTIETLYVLFGINLSIPDLFVTGFDEGSYENLTGQTYGDLDNLCPNSRNHFDNIDSNVKPSNVIVDVISVGYAVDGEVQRITSVLTY